MTPETLKDSNASGDALRLAGILSSILKPLLFASKDGYRHLNSVKGVDGLVTALSDDALSVCRDEPFKGVFNGLKALFTGFDTLTAEEKKERLRDGIALATSIEPREDPPAVTAEEAGAMLSRLSTSLEFVKGIGPKLSERLAKKGLSTVEDILYFLPIRYEDRRDIKRIKDLVPGSPMTTCGEVAAQGETRYGRRKVYEMALTDGSGILKVKWLNYKLSYMKGRYKQGQRLLVFGTVSSFGGQKEMIHPDIEVMDTTEESPAEKGIVPVYSQVENFHQKTIRKIVRGVVEGYSGSAVGGLPAQVIRRCGLYALKDAFISAHMPSDHDHELAKKSLVFDELFLLELGLALKRREI
ncbi:MAG TPA: OB-fold nucleic acid binding domain-containing protein, partial [Thermodesulfobacteriota bacterium]|nr:OB-fold nucleic acid binding domain-containing protein [Thermodesulfobacteriota bacterium]